ncbi:MAG: LacI family transcriptional regulator [bacterium]|nr:LacI family transcriptional regulator [bacterium]
MAPACLKAVKEAGLNVPQDISIICYIDSELMSLLDPPLTAVRLPYYDMGKKAAELLLEDRSDKKKWIFETELAIRDSTASVRQ